MGEEQRRGGGKRGREGKRKEMTWWKQKERDVM